MDFLRIWSFLVLADGGSKVTYVFEAIESRDFCRGKNLMWWFLEFWRLAGEAFLDVAQQPRFDFWLWAETSRSTDYLEVFLIIFGVLFFLWTTGLVEWDRGVKAVASFFLSKEAVSTAALWVYNLRANSLWNDGSTFLGRLSKSALFLDSFVFSLWFFVYFPFFEASLYRVYS